jgi:ligand-binding sensor domain-containing protein
MRTKLTALLAAVALLGLAGAARADTQPATRTDTQVVTLTDAQLDNVTAGVAGWLYIGTQYFAYYYNGQYWYSTGAFPVYIWVSCL